MKTLLKKKKNTAGKHCSHTNHSHTNFSRIENEHGTKIENQCDVTVLFPDDNHVTDSNGGFNSQEEFRDFVSKHQHSRVTHTVHSRPTEERKKDCLHDEFVRSFPLQFPHGFGALKKQQTGKTFVTKNCGTLSTPDVLRLFLRHRRREFHTPEFNLVANNLIMRDKVFLNVRIQCNSKFQERSLLSEKFGDMESNDLMNSINKTRADMCLNPRNPSDQFLRSITAVCNELPHTNDATVRAKQQHFSLLARFGPPTLFVTMSPDDQRSAWIRVFLLRDKKSTWTNRPSVDDVKDEDIIFECKQRCNDRMSHPGLCAEDCMATMETFVTKVLKWNRKTCKAEGMGLFGEVEAWSRATEEQGRKSLHGHFLLWIANWNEVMFQAMAEKHTSKEWRKDTVSVRNCVAHCASSATFQDFKHDKPLARKGAPFVHESCRAKRAKTDRKFAVEPVASKQLHEMRRASKCHEHDGHIATCKNCNQEFTIQDVMQSTLNQVFSPRKKKFQCPDSKSRRLDTSVFEMQKDMNWPHAKDDRKEERLFAANVLANTHRAKHTTRCFKKGCICHANLPADTCEKQKLEFCSCSTEWVDWQGKITRRRIFEFEKPRDIQDVCTNAHNPLLTMLFLCNNDVIAAMTGAAVLHVTGHNSKKTQKEERRAHETVAKVLMRMIENQVRGTHRFFLRKTFTDHCSGSARC